MDFRGDFNVLKGKSERINCVGVECGSQEFCDFIDKSNLFDLPLVGRKFTWVGPGNKRSRLDRFLLDELWMVKYGGLRKEGCNRTVSDHVPIMFLMKKWTEDQGRLSSSIGG